MIKDRLQDLRARQPGGFSQVNQVTILINNTDDSNQITAFLAEVEGVRALIESIWMNTGELRKLYGIILSLPMAQDRTNAEVDSRTSSVQRAIVHVRGKLQDMEKQLNDPDCEEQLDRIRSIQYASLSRLFVDAVQEYNSVLVRHREKCAQLIREQIKITDKDITGEELEALLDRGESAMFVDNIISETLEAKLTLDALRARHEELRKVETSIKEVHDVFVQLALLVETQGETLDRVEHYVEKATAYADRTKRKMEKNERRKKIRRKRKYKCIFFTLVIIIVILFILIYI
ncbi:syntaxin-1A isoform X2 [Bacillus rossius redtenbacheri]|uniref:syntaxin-1A isoform X2 n=1 Tax=Bacillus rossius redtenbacheri TaxID=93214 RepID=UPI002FDD13FE